MRQTQGVRQIDVGSFQTASGEMVRDINRDILLELIRIKQPLARAELSRLSGLRHTTVSVIVEQLIRENWVQEVGVIKPARGRPSAILCMNSDKVTLAVDLRPDRGVLAVVDLCGRFLSRETVPASSDLCKTVAQIGNRMRDLREEHSTRTFEGIGVSLPGRVQPTTHRVLLASNMSWHEFDLKEAFEEATGLPVEIDNDASVCLISELWFGRLQGAKDVVLVAVAEGVGTAILSDGHIHSGYNGMAGEFGHISVDPNGPLCQCGQKGCWQMFASSRAPVRSFNNAKQRRVKDIYELFRLSDEGDETATRALSEQARALGRGLRLITASISPELILIVGDITTCWDRFGPIVAQELASSMLAGAPPLLRAAGDAELARLSGSAAMFMQRHATYHHSTHT